ncbi:hypothetical protein HZ994_13530 [Akkermansiaceae bacterium]|nr:hypothetical protein HZ994_13530 [Akkermansiaceae bacterium]
MTSEETLLGLLGAWLDGDAPEAEMAEMLAALDADPELRREFAAQLAINGALSAAAEPEPRWMDVFGEFADAQAEEGDFEGETMARIQGNGGRPHFSKGRIIRYVALGIAASVALVVSLHLSRPIPPRPPTVAHALPQAPHPIAVVTGSEGRTPADAAMHDGSFLPSGKIAQENGWLGIQTLTGVSITFTAPFRATIVSPNRVFVEKGQARVLVPEGAEGFVMESRAFEVLDLGTEFVTTVNADGTGSCRVFEGMADVSFLNGLRQTSATHRVNAGESVRISPSQRSMEPLADKATDYLELKVPPKPILALKPSYPTDVLALGPTDYWRFSCMKGQKVENEIHGRPEIIAFGDVSIDTETGGNHSGRLKYQKNNGAFVTAETTPRSLGGDFTVAMFVQLDWLQNYTLFASSRWTEDPAQPRGNQLLFKAYASFEQSGLQGTGLYAVFRDKPAWDGGTEIFGNRLMRPKFWHHVALARNSGEAVLYLDGNPVARQCIPAIPIDFDHLYIGRSDSPHRPPEFLERGLIGNIDELAIFDRMLSEAEIASLAAGQTSP